VSDLDFCSEAEFREGNARLKVLELREQGHPAFCNMKMIPPNARELPEGLLKVKINPRKYKYINVLKTETNHIKGI